MLESHDLIIIGAGAAGLASYKGAKDSGIKDILIIEKDKQVGGILNQCIHNGFGLQTFKEELSGPSYAEKYLELLNNDINILYETTVLEINDLVVTISNNQGIKQIKAKAIILATGSKEKPAGAIGLKGDRVTGVMSAGTAQKYVNTLGYLPGKKVFILGSGDIGLIMARRMLLEGAEVLGVAEIMPYSNGLARNIKQCLEDYNIPLYLSTTVDSVHGDKRVEYITLVDVDEKLNKIENTQRNIECDCLLLSIGLLPDISLIDRLGVKLDPKTKSVVVDENNMSSIEGIFVSGNCLQIHDLVDYVTSESYKTGLQAANYIHNIKDNSKLVKNNIINGLNYIIPQHFHIDKDIEFSFRVNKPYKDPTIHIFGRGLDLKIKKLACLPSLMEKVTIKKEQLADIEDELNWEIIS